MESSGGAEPKSRKRPRAARACESCRAKKYKCDEDYPCSQCRKLKCHCVYPGAEHVRRELNVSSYVADLERRVQELSAKVGTSPTQSVIAMDQPGDIQQPVLSTDGQRGRNSVQGNGHLTIDGLLMQSSTSPPSAQTRQIPTLIQPENEEVSEGGAEITDVNQHTRSVEFHGNTSSMAFLALLQKQNQGQNSKGLTGDKVAEDRPSLVSTMHNVGFSPDSKAPSPAPETKRSDETYYFRQAGRFIDGYFENLHFIHPILDKGHFLARCEDLWFGRADRQTRGFVALYYSILSLGALVRVWDETKLDGMNRFQWSRKLFTHARTALGGLRSTNDLETIQCLIFMAKICQNELNPNLAYMYLGMAVRASLSAGYHRDPAPKEHPEILQDTQAAISKTWWGLYSLEVEMSFSLGRPDSVGMEEYHNRMMPPVDETEIAIIPCMIPFARITRQVSVATLSKKSLREKIATANDIESEMERWLSSLPDLIQPDMAQQKGLKILKDPKWARRQRLVLQIRYCNVKMILYRPFLAYAAQSQQRLPPLLEFTLAKCVDAARRTIEIMHTTFCNHVFFRSWWYNTTYILYAASIILSYATQTAPSNERNELFKLIDMSVEVLEAMEECFVASKASEMIKQALENARIQSISQEAPPVSYDLHPSDQTATEWTFNSMLDNQMPYMPITSMFDFEDTDFNFTMDDMQFMFAPC